MKNSKAWLASAALLTMASAGSSQPQTLQPTPEIGVRANGDFQLPGGFPEAGLPAETLPDRELSIFTDYLRERGIDPEETEEWTVPLTQPLYGPDAMPVGPGVIVATLQTQIDENCPGGLLCPTLYAALAQTEQTNGQYSECDRAAHDYNTFVRPSDSTASHSRKFEIGLRYDINCLAGMHARLGPNLTLVERSELPSNLRASGVLQAIGFLRDDEGFFCSGLIRPGNRFLTAKHCFVGRKADFQFGFISFQRAADPERTYNIQLPGGTSDEAIAAISDVVGVVDDWIELEIVSDTDLAAPSVSFAEPQLFAPITVFGPYRAPPASEALESVDFKNPTLALRWPRPGFCYAIKDHEQCVSLMCQTVGGFSGSPVFNLATPAGSPLEVIGIISGAAAYKTAVKQCDSKSRFDTAAVPAREFK